jgi:hypothetical protein
MNNLQGNKQNAEKKVTIAMKLGSLVLDIARAGVRDKYGYNISETQMRQEINKRIALKDETENLWSKKKFSKR